MSASLDYYEGAYGPTIRFAFRSLEELKALREMMRRLAAGEAREVALHELGCLSVSHLEALTLAVVDVEARVSLRRWQGESYLWVNTREGWEICCGLVDGLIQANEPGHQYLTDEGVDDALVEVCLFERVDPL
ncbi:MAG: hypothetical protein JNM84_02755 [Planctomycetes bacterium]|nr:hypothetical protein [Planctomycetota bacterium]